MPLNLDLQQCAATANGALAFPAQTTIAHQGSLNVTHIYRAFFDENATRIRSHFKFIREYSTAEIVTGITANGQLIASGLQQKLEELLSMPISDAAMGRLCCYFSDLKGAVLSGDLCFQLFVPKLRKEEEDTTLGDLQTTAAFLPYVTSLLPSGVRTVYLARDATSYFECELILNGRAAQETSSQVLYVSRFLLGPLYERACQYRTALLQDPSIYQALCSGSAPYFEGMYALFLADYERDLSFRKMAGDLFHLLVRSLAWDGSTGKRILWCDIGFFGTIPLVLRCLFRLLAGEESEIFSGESYMPAENGSPLTARDCPEETNRVKRWNKQGMFSIQISS
jgi:hypothetical protein